MAALLAFMGEAALGDVLTFLSGAVATHHRTAGPDRPFSSALRALLDATVQRIEGQRTRARRRGAPVDAYVDAAERIVGEGVVLRGWLAFDASDRVKSIAIVSLFGERVELPYPLASVARPDVVEAMAKIMRMGNRDAGFVAFASAPDIHPEDQRWFVEVLMESGSVRRAPFRLGPAGQPRRTVETLVDWAEEGDRRRRGLQSSARAASEPALAQSARQPAGAGRDELRRALEPRRDFGHRPALWACRLPASSDREFLQ